MKSEELLDQLPTVDKTAEDELQAFLQASPHEDAKVVTEPPIKQPNPLPPEPELQRHMVDVGPGQVEVVDEQSFQAELDAAQEQLDLLKMAPEQRYRAILERENITLDEARKIIDTLVNQLKPYQERFKLSPSLSVVFKTRSQADQERFNRVLETEQPRYDNTVRTYITMYNLSASLVRYGDQTFQRETDEDVQFILKWLSQIPAPVFVLMTRKLSEFDRKIDLVFQEGWLENF